MKLEIHFKKPYDVSPNDLDGIKIRFPFQVKKIGEGALRDTFSEHYIDVLISGTLCTLWWGARFPGRENPDFIKVLFMYAKQRVIESIKSNKLNEKDEINLHTGNSPKEYPYDPNKFNSPEKTTVKMEIEDADKAKPDLKKNAAIKAFISYSWDDEEHKKWVLGLATQLRSDGIDVYLDQWHTAPGDQLPKFMERSIRENNFVLIICTPRYKLKADKRQGGVGYEEQIMTAEVFSHHNHRKFIPILKTGKWDEAAPSWLLGKYYLDLTSYPEKNEGYIILVNTIKNNLPKIPPIGMK